MAGHHPYLRFPVAGTRRHVHDAKHREVTPQATGA